MEQTIACEKHLAMVTIYFLAREIFLKMGAWKMYHGADNSV